VRQFDIKVQNIIDARCNYEFCRGGVIYCIGAK